MTLVIALVLSLAMGLSLGLLGGGGSILTVPILVHAFGLAPKEAIATSLVVVGTTSAAALVPHLAARRVRFRTGLSLGASSMVAAYVAGHLARFVPESVLLVGFAALMLVTALAMLRGRPTGREPRERSVSLARRDRLEERGRLASGAVLGIGLVLGTATGLFGAGGGFLAVPALVIFGGLPMAEAAATSLLVITMNSVAGLLGSLDHVTIAWPLAAMVSACAITGSLAGVRLAGRIPQAKLRRAFAGLVAVIGVFMLVERAPEAFGFEGAVAAVAVPSRPIGAMLESYRHLTGVVQVMESFTPVASTTGGVLIGVAATLLLLALGRIAGVSGIFAGALVPRAGETLWRVAFVLGLVAGGFVFARFAPEAFAVHSERSLAVVGIAGALVGFGTRLGSGCTSGHGVCGISRLSPRSLVATLSFMLTGGLTVFVAHHVLGGSL